MQIVGTVHARAKRGLRHDPQQIADAIRNIIKSQLGIDVDIDVRVVKAVTIGAARGTYKGM